MCYKVTAMIAKIPADQTSIPLHYWHESVYYTDLPIEEIPMALAKRLCDLKFQGNIRAIESVDAIILINKLP